MTGMRLLKSIVILGGVLLIMGFIVLFIRIAKQTNPTQPPNPKPVVENTLTLTPGSRIQNILSTGQGIAIWAATTDGNAEIFFLDAKGNTGKHLKIRRHQTGDGITPLPAPQTPEN